MLSAQLDDNDDTKLDSDFVSAKLAKLNLSFCLTI